MSILYDEDGEQQPFRYRYPLGQLYDFVYHMGHRSPVQQLDHPETRIESPCKPSVRAPLGFDMWQHPQ